MNFAMIGLDFKSAPIAVREKISLTKSKITTALTRIHETYQIAVVILSTCNRTEFYFASEMPLHDTLLVEIYKETVNTECPYYTKHGQEVVDYLFALNCGLHSMILGEDQIITQIKDALDLSMEQHTSNAPLNTLFRHSITCAKKAKTQVNIQFISPSIVSKSMEIAQSSIQDLTHKKVLVIGNGEMGRLAATLFTKAGCTVYMTLRQYKYHETVIPNGCTAIPYEERSCLYSEVDIIVSATKSPHYTITYDAFAPLAHIPSFLFDLALPRDIEPEIKKISGVQCFDVDDIGRNQSHYNEEAIAQIHEIIDAQKIKFEQWLQFHLQQKKECV